MEKNSSFEELEKSGNIINRRRDLLPLWIKIFTWLFLIAAAITLLIPVSALFVDEVELTIYGLSSTQVYIPVGITIISLFLLKGVTAYGLWFEKAWAPKLAVIDAVIGIAVCVYMMIFHPVLSGLMEFSVRLELVALIPYLLKMQRIQPQWLNTKIVGAYQPL